MKKTLITTMILTSLFTGCSTHNIIQNTSNSKVTNSNNITQIKFKDMVSINELKKLNGKQIKITGFISQASPLDGSIIYLMNMPYQNCVFCVPNTNQLVNTLAIYPEKNKSFTYTDVPIEVTGTLVFEDTTDEVGYYYDYKLINASYKEADATGLEDTVRIFTSLINQGFTNALMDTIYEIDTQIKNFYLTDDITTLNTISTDNLSEIDSMFENLNKEEYSDLLPYIDLLKSLVRNLNKDIEEGISDNISKYKDESDEIYNGFYFWTLKPEL